MVEVKIPGSKSYYAIEYRRGDDGSDANAAAFRRGWDSYDVGIRSDRVTVYLVEPDLYADNDNDLGDANLAAVLNPGGSYSSPDGRLTVSFDGVVNTFDTSHTNAAVTIKTPQPAAPLTFLSVEGSDGAWLNHDVTAYLFPYQPDQGAPIATTYYGVDDRGCNEQTRDCAVYAPDGFPVAGDGVHDVTYFTTDVAGGSEIIRHATIRIDKTPPSTTASVAATDGGPRVLTLAATDSLSGVAGTDYDLDGAGFQPYRDAVADRCRPARTRSVSAHSTTSAIPRRRSRSRSTGRSRRDADRGAHDRAPASALADGPLRRPPPLAARRLPLRLRPLRPDCRSAARPLPRRSPPRSPRRPPGSARPTAAR